MHRAMMRSATKGIVVVSSAMVSSVIVSSALVSGAMVGSVMVGSAMVGSVMVGSAMAGSAALQFAFEVQDARRSRKSTSRRSSPIARKSSVVTLGLSLSHAASSSTRWWLERLGL